MTKKASANIGLAVIMLAVLLLISNIALNSDSNNNNSNNNNDDYTYNSSYPDQNYLFYLNETEIGRQQKIIITYPNIQVGSKSENSVIFQSNSVKLNANFLSNNYYEITIPKTGIDETSYYLIYAKVERENGNSDMIFEVNNNSYYTGQGSTSDFPIVINPINNNNENSSNSKLLLKIQKPKFYQIWKWDKIYLKDLRIVEVKKNLKLNQRKYDFEIENNKYLENLYLKLTADCNEIEDNHLLEININNYTADNIIFDCEGRYNTKDISVPLSILQEGKNTIEFKSNKHVQFSYNLQKVYLNEQYKYRFSIYDFNDITDLVMFGDFDKEVVDMRINDRHVTLNDDEMISILEYVKYGSNEIEFLDKPLGIKEFYIEKEDWYWN